MELHKLKPVKGDKKSAKRVGRGYSSGRGGHTSGRGNKGQKARKSGGGAMPLGFEGGQVPLFKKLPHIGGFKNHNSKQIISIHTILLENFKEGTEVSPQMLLDAGLVEYLPKHGIKFLLAGKIKHKLKLSGFLYSASAREALEQAGCILS